MITFACPPDEPTPANCNLSEEWLQFLRYRSQRNNEKKVFFPRDVVKWRPKGKGEHLVQSDYEIILIYDKALEERDNQIEEEKRNPADEEVKNVCANLSQSVEITMLGIPNFIVKLKVIDWLKSGSEENPSELEL